MFILELDKALKAHKVKYTIIGGLALALRGIVRATVDVDLAITLSESSFKATETALTSIGLISRLPVKASDVFHFRSEYIENRNLLAWNFYDPKNPLHQVDILITTSREEIEQSSVKIMGHNLPVATFKALLKLKKASGRPIDLLDIGLINEKIKND